MRSYVHIRLIFFFALAAIYAGFPNARPDLTELNSSDSEVYLSLSYAVTHGLGYTRSLVSGIYIPHTTFFPGFPLLLAPITAFSSLPLAWLCIKIYMIGIGLTGIVLAWVYVRRLTNDVGSADIAALLLALLPYYWLLSRTAMTEIPSISYILLTLVLVDLTWAQRPPRAWQVALVGLIAGLGMMLRGTNLCTIFAPLGYLIGSRKAVATPLGCLALFAFYGTSFCLPSILWAVRNASIDPRGLGFDGIDEFRMIFASDWMDRESLYSVAELLQRSIENFSWYAIYRLPQQLIPGLWNAEWWNWPGAPFVALGLTAAVALAALPRTTVALPLALTIIPYANFLSVYPRGGAVRYWSPVTALLILLLVVNWRSVLEALSRRARRATMAGLTACYAVSLIGFVHKFEVSPYADDFADMVALFDSVRNLLPPPPAVHVYHSCLFTLRTGFAAPITIQARRVEPIYTHLILHNAGNPTVFSNPSGVVRQPALGSALLLRRGEWGYYALPKPMTERELSNDMNREAERTDGRDRTVY